jgi:hypothetical protein
MHPLWVAELQEEILFFVSLILIYFMFVFKLSSCL